MNILNVHYMRACCILDKISKTDEELQTALNDLCIYIENTKEGESDKQLADAYFRRGQLYESDTTHNYSGCTPSY